MVSNALMKAWLIKLIIGSSLIIMFIWLCSVDMAGTKQLAKEHIKAQQLRLDEKHTLFGPVKLMIQDHRVVKNFSLAHDPQESSPVDVLQPVLPINMSIVVWGSDLVRQGENGKHNYLSKKRLSSLTDPNTGVKSLEETRQQNHLLGSLPERLPNLDFRDQLQELSKNEEQQPPQQKHQNETSREDFQKRRRRVNYVCSLREVNGTVRLFMADKQAGVLYCVVPKAGCTFWKRIFTALNLKSNGAEEAISSLTRAAVHDPGNSGLMHNYTYFNTTNYLTRFLVTRDPYSRLVSSYIDKIYLPDFWNDEVVKMAKNLSKQSSPNGNGDFLRNHFNEMAKIFQNTSYISTITTHTDSTCGKYMTFFEFVENGLDREEPHWMPIHTICNPCSFKVTHISTIETFAADARFILSRMNMEHVIENSDQKAQVDEEINLVSQYNFHIYNKNKSEAFFKSCISPREIAYRLWHSLQWKGYIDPDINYRLPDVTNLQDVEADFMVQFKVARESGLQNPKKMKAAQKEFKRKAFLSLSKTTFERITQKYALDLELFGYTDMRDEMYTYYST